MNGSYYDDEITMSINVQLWIQVKRVKKMCDNDTEKKVGEEVYEPCYKFDYIWISLVHNMNILIEEDDLGLCGDDTSWSTASYGESGAVVTDRVNNNLVVT